MKLSIGDKVRFYLGSTPFIGTILFAVTQDAAAVRLAASGTEMIISLDTVTAVL